jgi:hypothetical protein
MDLKVNGTIIPLHGKFVVDIYLDPSANSFPRVPRSVSTVVR